MSFVDRIKNILEANINDLLDRAEDPEKMLKQLMREAKNAVGDTRALLIEEKARLKLLEKDVETAQRQSRRYGENARLAVSRGDSQLAARLLHDQIQHEENASEDARLAAEQEARVKGLEKTVSLLETKAEQMERYSARLIDRHRRSTKQEQIVDRLAKLSYDPTSDFRRFEQRISEKEALVESKAEVLASQREARLAQLGESVRDGEVQARLLRIQAELDQQQLPAGKDPGRP